MKLTLAQARLYMTELENVGSVLKVKSRQDQQKIKTHIDHEHDLLISQITEAINGRR